MLRDSLTRSNLKPIRTSAASASAQTRCNSYRSDDGDGRGFVKKKSRSLKNIYGDLKKSKQEHHPISPGGRLASFLNSLFTAGAAKKDDLNDMESRVAFPHKQLNGILDVLG
ncbi:Protein BIG GRAIN 1-like A, partial [Linum perenne]